jgi:hypothetical protein
VSRAGRSAEAAESCTAEWILTEQLAVAPAGGRVLSARMHREVQRTGGWVHVYPLFSLVSLVSPLGARALSLKNKQIVQSQLEPGMSFQTEVFL